MNIREALKGEGSQKDRLGEGSHPTRFVLLLPGDLWIDHVHLSLEYVPGPTGHLSYESQSQGPLPSASMIPDMASA